MKYEPPQSNWKQTMKHLVAVLLFAIVPVSTPVAAQAAAQSAEGTGLISRISPFSVAATLDRLEAVLKAKGVKVFTRINHAAEAQSVGLSLRPTELLIFGNPKAGTPLMLASQSIGLDLPMKALAWQDAQGQVQLTWNSPDYLTGRHGLDVEFNKNLAAVGGLIEAALKP
jgi:uncharacterized protein (DUF302 family)